MNIKVKWEKIENFIENIVNLKNLTSYYIVWIK